MHKGNCLCSHGHEKHARNVGTATARTIDVSYRGRSARVDLGSLARQRVEGKASALLADVWVASRLEGDLLGLRFVLVGADGFRSDKHAPAVEGMLLTRGFLLLASRDAVWSSALMLPCSAYVKNVTTLVAEDDLGLFPPWGGSRE